MPIPSVGTVTASAPSVGQYQKLELTFPVTTQATNPDLPYDTSVPAWQSALPSGFTSVPPKEDATQGVSVDGLFLPPGQSDWAQALVHPCFLYRDFVLTADTSPLNVLGLYNDQAADPDLWKCRFAPGVTGAWQYKIRVTDAGGTVTSAAGNFTCVASTSKGFMRVAAKDTRYFQFDAQAGTDEAACLLGLNNPTGGLTTISADIDAIAAKGATGLMRLWIGSRSGLEVIGGWSDSAAGRTLAYSGTDSGLLTPGRNNSRYCFNLPGDGHIDSAQVSLKPNTDYTLSFWAYAASATALAVMTQDTDTYANHVDYTVGGTTGQVAVPAGAWTHITLTWAGHDPRGGLNYRAQFSLNGTNGGVAVLIDDIQVLDPAGHDVFGVGDFERHVQYNQRQSWELDQIIAEAEAKGQYVRLNCLENNDDMFTDAPSDGGIPATYHDKDQFFGQDTDPAADLPVRRWQSYYARYLQARWGYSTAVAQFEYNNEGTAHNGYHLAGARSFARALHSYTAHGRRLASTSVATPSTTERFDETVFRAGDGDLDWADLHYYATSSYEATPYDPLNAVMGALPGGVRGLGCMGTSANVQSSMSPTHIRGQGTWNFSITIQADAGVNMNWFESGPFVQFQSGDLFKVGIPTPQQSPPLTGQGLPWTTFTGTFDLPDDAEYPLSVTLYASNYDTSVPLGGTVRFQDFVLTAPDGRVWARHTFDEPSMRGDNASLVMYTTQPFVSLSGDPDLGKPLTTGETGMIDWDQAGTQAGYDLRYQQDTQGTWMRQMSWASVSPSAPTPILWPPTDYDSSTNGHWEHAAAYQKFLTGIPLANGRYRNIEALTSTPEAIVTGQRDVQAGRAHFWAYNRAGGNWLDAMFAVQGVGPNTLTLAGLPDGACTVETWDADGNVLSTSSATSVSGSLPLPTTTATAYFAAYPASSTRGADGVIHRAQLVRLTETLPAGHSISAAQSLTVGGVTVPVLNVIVDSPSVSGSTTVQSIRAVVPAGAPLGTQAMVWTWQESDGAGGTIDHTTTLNPVVALRGVYTPPITTTIVIPGLPDGTYQADQVDPTTGQTSRTSQAASASGSLTLSVDLPYSSVAMRIYPTSPAVTPTMNIPPIPPVMLQSRASLAGGSTVPANSLVPLKAAQSGLSYRLADPATCRGQSVVFVWEDAGSYTITLTSTGGLINGSSSAVFSSSATAGNCRILALYSDGSDYYGQVLSGGIS